MAGTLRSKETARVHHAHRRRGGVAARCAEGFAKVPAGQHAATASERSAPRAGAAFVDRVRRQQLFRHPVGSKNGSEVEFLGTGLIKQPLAWRRAAPRLPRRFHLTRQGRGLCRYRPASAAPRHRRTSDRSREPAPCDLMFRRHFNCFLGCNGGSTRALVTTSISGVLFLVSRCSQ
jgi:hypothetical protein